VIFQDKYVRHSQVGGHCGNISHLVSIHIYSTRNMVAQKHTKQQQARIWQIKI